MERLEVHNKAYIVKWTHVPTGHRLRWSVYPKRRSINVAIISRNATSKPNVRLSGPSDLPRPDKTSSANTKTDSQAALTAKGMNIVHWVGKCQADLVTEGIVDVVGEADSYGIVFDNTFSKQISKIVLSSVSCEPIEASAPLLAKKQLDSLHPSADSATADRSKSGRSAAGRSRSANGRSSSVGSGTVETALSFSGILLKKRRKKNQGYARRLFTLDQTTATLSYYKDAQSSALRGAIPLALAAVSTDRQSGIIVVDSGVEVWHLKATSTEDYDGWEAALTKAMSISDDAFKRNKTQHISGSAGRASIGTGVAEWTILQPLTSQLAGVRAAVSRLVKEADPAGWNEPSSRTTSRSPSPAHPDRHLNVPGGQRGRTNLSVKALTGFHESFKAVHADLDHIVSSLFSLMTTHTPRDGPLEGTARSSLSEDEFHDADGEHSGPNVLLPFRNDDEEELDASVINDADTDDDDDHQSIVRIGGLGQSKDELVGPATDLSPLPLSAPVRRRTEIAAPTTEPPSLLKLFSEVGSKGTAMSMSVDSNEPLSMLQKFAEQFEFASLLDVAASKPAESGEQILYVAAFAISYLSCMREKSRAKRKPFNPMLGETFELVREDLGFRLMSEKVSHHPLGMAIHGQGDSWSMIQAPRPSQKFLGKSVEVRTEGDVHIFFHRTNDHFSYSPALTYLRNIIAGEKYIDPAEKMTIYNRKSGQTAVVTFPVGSFFSGRSEDVTVAVFDEAKNKLAATMAGKWTEKLVISGIPGQSASPIWSVNKLSAPPYGLTSFAASLNEVTEIEKERIAPTDSRLRPDQTLLEQQKMDQSRATKDALEQRQRLRHVDGINFVPRWFVPIEGVVDVDGNPEELFKLKTGDQGYWAQRASGQFTGCLDIFTTD